MAGVVSAGLRRWPLSGWLRAGVRCLYDLGGNSAGKRAQVLTFSPCLLSLSPSLLLWMSSRSPAGSVCLIWASWQHRGGGRRVHLAGVLGVSCSPAAGGRAGRSRAVSVVRLPCWSCWGSLCGRWGWRWARLANQQNAQRFNKKCSIMTKMMGCILYFLRYKYVCFGVK